MTIDKTIELLNNQIGSEIGVSDWVTIDQTMIDAFAACTFDHQWIHTDPTRAAAESPFGGAIAHGFLTLSLGSKFIAECVTDLPGQVMGVNYGFDKLRFLAPVPAGAHVRGRFTMLGVKKRSETELLRTVRMTVEIEGQDTLALVAEWLGLIVFAPDAG